MQSLPRY